MAFLSCSPWGDFSSSCSHQNEESAKEIEQMKAKIVSGVENYTLDDATHPSNKPASNEANFSSHPHHFSLSSGAQNEIEFREKQNEKIGF